MRDACDGCVGKKRDLSCETNCDRKECRALYRLIEYGIQLNIIDFVYYEYYRYKNLLMVLKSPMGNTNVSVGVDIYVIDNDFVNNSFTSIHSYKGRYLKVYGEVKIGEYGWLVNGLCEKQLQEMKEEIFRKKKELYEIEEAEIKQIQERKNEELQNNISYFTKLLQ